MSEQKLSFVSHSKNTPSSVQTNLPVPPQTSANINILSAHGVCRCPALHTAHQKEKANIYRYALYTTSSKPVEFYKYLHKNTDENWTDGTNESKDFGNLPPSIQPLHRVPTYQTQAMHHIFGSLSLVTHIPELQNGLPLGRVHTTATASPAVIYTDSVYFCDNTKDH